MTAGVGVPAAPACRRHPRFPETSGPRGSRAPARPRCRCPVSLSKPALSPTPCLPSPGSAAGEAGADAAVAPRRPLATRQPKARRTPQGPGDAFCPPPRREERGQPAPAHSRSLVLLAGISGRLTAAAPTASPGGSPGPTAAGRRRPGSSLSGHCGKARCGGGLTWRGAGRGGRQGGREGGGRPAASRAGSGRAGPAPSLPPPPPHHGKWAGAGREQRPPAPPQPPSPPPGAAAGPAAQPPSTGAFSGLRLRAAGTGFLRPGRRAGAGPGADPRRGRPGRCCPKSLKQTEVFAGCPKKPSPRGGGLKPGSASRIPLSWRAGGLGVVPKRCGSGSFVLGKNETWGFLKSRSAGIIRVGFRGKTCSLESACQPVC